MEEVKSLCDSWHWDLIDASAFVEKDFAFDHCYMVDKARVTDQRTGQDFTVGIVNNKLTGQVNSLGENCFTAFLATGEGQYLSDGSNLDVN